jgi:GNAT superfamily N-acetyltransferase
MIGGMAVENVLIRQARREDASAIARIHVDVSRTAYRGIMPAVYLASLLYEPRAEVWEGMLQTGFGDPWYIFVAEAESTGVVGVAVGSVEQGGSTLYTGELSGLYVHNGFQRQGIGRRLVATVAGQLARCGHRNMLLWVLADNPYRRFYDTLGGTPVDEMDVTVGGVDLPAVAYAWDDIAVLCGDPPPDAAARASR